MSGLLKRKPEQDPVLFTLKSGKQITQGELEEIRHLEDMQDIRDVLDNGFPCLYSTKETVSFARNFHNIKLKGLCRYQTVKMHLEKVKNREKGRGFICRTRKKRYKPMLPWQKFN